jgi:hypothetical protein
MIPDTSVYMIAGFAVILGGIFFYTLSIFLRSTRTKSQADIIAAICEDQYNESSDSDGEKHEN